jgi:hypothetical protein
MAIALSDKLTPLPAEIFKEDRPGGLRFHLLLLALALGLGSFLQVAGPPWARSIFDKVRIDSLSGMSALLLALLASILAHELGHLFAALFLNYQILGGSIGPFRVDWWNNRGRLGQFEGGWSRCSISAVPLELHNCWRARMLMVVGAGPAVSLLFLLAAASVALRAPLAADWAASWLTSFWSAAAEINFFLFILGLVPNGRAAAVPNDATLFLAVWENNEEAVDLFMCHQAIELALRRIRPQDYPSPLLRELANFECRPQTRLTVARRIVEWAADSGDIALAGEWDDCALAVSMNCTSRLANCALAESACFDVLFRQDLRSAVHKFAKVEFDELFPPPLAERARAARLVACGLPQRAEPHILRARNYLPPGNPYFDYERTLLDKLQSKACRKTIAAPGSASLQV